MPYLWITALAVSLLLCPAHTQDWSAIAVPADPESGHVWQLQEAYSDDFNYTGKTSAFTGKWRDTYINSWRGPGLTEWAADQQFYTLPGTAP